MEQEIIELLEKKSAVKQAVYRKTQAVFSDLQEMLEEKSKRISA